MTRSTRSSAQPLGSLTQREAADDVACAACGSPRVTRIAMQLTDGSPVEFVSCRRCEHRSWLETSGSALTVDRVLEKARKVKI
jgi:DNA-directed RNA polymerase subunit M/transcription elongation factor TFIIS